ncbi:MAG: reactive intermediate/imine deaminase [Sphingobacteriaceae bacterium]|jgi:2-iminobutanoate/2-iminopropanoate deaminase|nr:reactive intermediate/imine deaminase [Sphingobacteriaceae bacterium]
MKQIITSNNAPAPIGPYSQAVQVDNMLYVSGQIPLNPVTNEIVNTSVTEETHQVMKNISAVLDEAGYTFADIVKTSIFLTNMSFFAEVNDVYGSYFESNYPARETIAVKGLPKDVNVEISVIAYKP